MHFTSTSGGVRFGLAIKLQNSESFHPELDFLSVQKDIGNGNRYARYIQACLVPHSDVNAVLILHILLCGDKAWLQETKPVFVNGLVVNVNFLWQ